MKHFYRCVILSAILSVFAVTDCLADVNVLKYDPKTNSSQVYLIPGMGDPGQIYHVFPMGEIDSVITSGQFAWAIEQAWSSPDQQQRKLSTGKLQDLVRISFFNGKAWGRPANIVGLVSDVKLIVSSDKTHAYAEFKHMVNSSSPDDGAGSVETLEVFNYNTSGVDGDSGRWTSLHPVEPTYSVKNGRFWGYIRDSAEGEDFVLTVNESLFDRISPMSPINDPESQQVVTTFFDSIRGPEARSYYDAKSQTDHLDLFGVTDSSYADATILMLSCSTPHASLSPALDARCKMGPSLSLKDMFKKNEIFVDDSSLKTINLHAVADTELPVFKLFIRSSTDRPQYNFIWLTNDKSTWAYGAKFNDAYSFEDNSVVVAWNNYVCPSDEVENEGEEHGVVSVCATIPKQVSGAFNLQYHHHDLGMKGPFSPNTQPTIQKTLSEEGIVAINRAQTSYGDSMDTRFYYHSFSRNSAEMLPPTPGWANSEAAVSNYQLVPAAAQDKTDAIVSCGYGSTAHDPVDGLRIQVATYDKQAKIWEWHGSSNEAFAPYLFPSYFVRYIKCKLSTQGSVTSSYPDDYSLMHTEGEPIWVIPDFG